MREAGRVFNLVDLLLLRLWWTLLQAADFNEYSRMDVATRYGVVPFRSRRTRY